MTTTAQVFATGRDLTTAEAIILARRATFDPGIFTHRLKDHNGPEELHRWQARAVVIALGPSGPSYEHQWSNLPQAIDNFDPRELDAEREPRP